MVATLNLFSLWCKRVLSPVFKGTRSNLIYIEIVSMVHDGFRLKKIIIVGLFFEKNFVVANPDSVWCC